MSGYDTNRFSLNSGSGGYRLVFTDGADGGNLYAESHTHSLQSHTHSLQSHTHTINSHNTNYAGSSGNITNANLPPYRAVNFIIYAGQ